MILALDNVTQIYEENKNINMNSKTKTDIIGSNNNYIFEDMFFLYSGMFLNFRKKLKLNFRILDMKKNLVSNDVTTKYFNDLKTVFERNIHLYKFIRKTLTFNPINKFRIMRNHIHDMFIKQQEINYISGKITPFRVIIASVNKQRNFYQQTSLNKLLPRYTKQLIFRTFVFIKFSTKNFLKFLTFTKSRKNVKTFFIGFKSKLRNRTRIKRRNISLFKDSFNVLSFAFFNRLLLSKIKT